MTDQILPTGGDVMTSSEVAALFRVDAKTVTRWAKAGKIASFRTLGGHRRFYTRDIQDLLYGQRTVI